MLLDYTSHGPSTHEFIVTVRDQPAAGLFRKLDGDIAVAKLRLELEHEFLHHFGDDLLREMRESDRGVEPIAEFRRKHLVDGFLIVAFPLAAGKAIGLLGEVRRTRVRRHDQI